MKPSILLPLTSVLAVLLASLHVADDIVRGFERGGLWNLTTAPTLVTWLYGTLVLAGRRSGYILTLLGSLLGAVMPVLHFRGAAGVTGGRIAGSEGVYFWVWTLLALGVCALFSILLSVQGLWRLRRSGKAEAEGR